MGHFFWGTLYVATYPCIFLKYAILEFVEPFKYLRCMKILCKLMCHDKNHIWMQICCSSTNIKGNISKIYNFEAISSRWLEKS